MTGSKRTKTGCITCKIRKVKCDETKPSCQRCTSTGRTCDGYSVLPYSREDLIASTASQLRRTSDHFSATFAALVSESVPLSACSNNFAFPNVWQKRCFQFFRHKTVSSTNALIDARFWSQVVLQGAHDEPAIKHGILALSAFDQSLIDHPNSHANHRFLADMEYQLCLKHAQNLLHNARERDIERVLITCLICIHYETARGQFKTSDQHMDNGRAIMRQYSRSIRQAPGRSDLAEVQQAFARLDACRGSFSDRSTPYLSTTENFYDTSPFTTAWRFSDIYEARACLVDLSRWLLLTRHQMYRAWLGGDAARFAKYEVESSTSKVRLKEWSDHFENFANEPNAYSGPVVLTLQLWYTALFLLMDPDLIGPETRYDQYFDNFERLVSLGEEIVRHLAGSKHNHFSYDLGYGIPIFFVAHRCRHPQLRRRAIEVLRAIPRQEGNFLSIPAAEVVERLMKYEEGEGTASVAADVSEERRVWLVAMQFDFDKSEVEAEFFPSPPGATEPNVIVERVHWTHVGK